MGSHEKRRQEIDPECSEPRRSKRLRGIDTRQEETKENGADQEEDYIHGQPFSQVLQSLLAITEETEKERNERAIREALRLNAAMQRVAKEKLAWINQQLQINQELIRQVRATAQHEAHLQRNRVEISKTYPEKIDFFVDDNGERPPRLAAADDAQSYVYAERSRHWSPKERTMLMKAVQMEAQRNMILELRERNEEWRFWEINRLGAEILENYPVNKLNWQRISELYVKTRNPMECMIQWTTQDHPKINKKPWNKSESAKLAELVAKHGVEGQWEKIAVELNTSRTASQCFRHYQSEKNLAESKRKWTPQDDEALRQAVEIFGDRNWQHVAAMVGTRSGQQCLQRWMKSINPAIRRSRWTPEEDEALRAAVGVYGVGNWNKVQRHIPGRTDMQCRERWTNCLDPNLKFDPLTEEECKRLTELVEKHGRKWSLIAQHFPGRTDNYIFRTYKALQKNSPLPGSKKQKQQD